MLLIKLTCFDEPEYLIFRQNRPVARWSATEAWENFILALLERLDLKVEAVDATNMVESFRQFGDEDSTDWDIPALIQEVLEEFGREALSQPLDHDQAMHLWEKARVLDGLRLEEDVRLSEF